MSIEGGHTVTPAWWHEETTEDEREGKLLAEIRRLRYNQAGRREMYRFYLEQYGVTEVSQLGIGSREAGDRFIPPSMPFNVVRRAIKTVHAKAAKNSPLPMVLATRGDYKENKRARGLTDFLGGLFEHLRVHADVSRQVCKYAETCGTGIAHVTHYEGDDFPRVRYVLPWEFFISPADARYGKPLHYYMVRWEDKEELLQRYADVEGAEEAIRSAAGNDTLPDMRAGAVGDDAEINNLVLVYYGWRVTVGGGKKEVKGRACVAIDSFLLSDEEYKRRYPPLAFLRYDKPLIGFYGEGLAAEIAGFQYELNYTTETLRMSHRTAPAGVWITDDNTGIPDTFFSNEIGYVLKKRPGTTVQYENPTPAPPQTYQWHDMVSEGALRWSGISTMSANAEKPAGVTAAVALNTLDDIEADNFAIFQKDYEQFHVDLGMLLIDEMKEIAKDNPDCAILARDKRSINEVKWSDVDMARDAIILDVFPVNLLGRTPAARRQMVADLFKDGVIDRSLYLKLLDAPDIDAEVDLDAATRTLVDEQIEHILDAEDVEAPDAMQHPMPYTDLVYALRRATQQVCLGILQKRPQGNISLLMQYIDEVKATLEEQNAEESAMQPGGTPPPPPGMMAPGAMAPPPGPETVGAMPGQGIMPGPAGGAPPMPMPPPAGMQ